MSKFEFYTQGKTVDLEPEEFAKLLGGSLIHRASFYKERFNIALDTSGKAEFNLEDGDLHATYYDHEREGVARVNLFDETKEAPTLAEFQQRLEAIRYLHVLFILLQSNRLKDLEIFLSEGLRVESKLIEREDQLSIVAAGEGSFWASLFSKSAKAIKSLGVLVALMYEKGRTAQLDRLRARADSDMVDVDRKVAELDYFRLHKAIEAIQKAEKIKDPALRQATLNALRHSMEKLGRALPQKPD